LQLFVYLISEGFSRSKFISKKFFTLQRLFEV
jgi:hypothetical protein